MGKKKTKLPKQQELQWQMYKVLAQEFLTTYIIDAVNHKIRVVRNDGKAENANEGLAAYDDGSYEEFIETFCNTYIIPEDRARIKRDVSIDSLMEKTQSGDLYQVDYMLVDESGKHCYYQGTYSRILDENGNVAFFYGCRDVSEIVEKEKRKQDEIQERRKQLAEAYETQEAQLEEIRVLNDELEIAKDAANAANRAKTAFLFNMSHDIRTPMNAIIGFTNLIEKNIDDKEQVREYLKKIQASNEFLLSLINNVLEMARIESGKASIDESYGNAREIYQAICSVFETQMKEKNLTFAHNLSVEHEDLLVDFTKFREIMLNLLSNAYKYTPAGGSVSMDIREIPSDKEGVAYYQVTIADTGIGMPEEFLPHLYEAFTREKTTTQSGIMGTGLGMLIVKEMVDLLGGTIDVTSKLGKGTTFVVTFPFRITERLAHNNKQENIVRDYKKFQGMRILLAEDNELNAEIAMTILTDKGFEVEHAEDGEAALKMAAEAGEGYYDFILMDIQMPRMNGYEATRRIRRLPRPYQAGIPIIAMTANAFDEDKHRTVLAGMNAHVGKPFDVDRLYDTIEDVLIEKDRYVHHDALEAFREKYQQLGCLCGFFVYRAGFDEQIIYADSDTAAIFGCSTVAEFMQFVGGSFKTMVHVEDIFAVQQAIEEQQQESSDNLDYIDYDIIRKDGVIRHVADVGYKVFNGTEYVYYVYLADVTELNIN
ncbi:MAG: response regulator [Selenomonas sp.]|uniref:PAS domain-containing hybrid sensor histidine kinase/response regulator n=1 Tax=Selenomonas sp. TaxID=2053611 RepID=UPI0025EDFF6F|nr:ATP-binding protein [Selenomonas sp.]MCR5438163.1 response regulator [Selenomonas sp.]